jgi:hypothetical protein
MVKPLDGDTLIQGNGKTASFSIANLDTGNLVNAGLRFILALLLPNGSQQHLVTLTRASGITVTTEIQLLIAGQLTIPGSATETLTIPRRGAIAQWDLEVVPINSEPITAQGSLLILPATRNLVTLQGTIAINTIVGGT